MAKEVTHAVVLRRGLSGDFDDILAVGDQNRCMKLTQSLTSMDVVQEAVVDDEDVLVGRTEVSILPIESIDRKLITHAQAVDLIRQPTLKFDPDKDEKPAKAKAKKRKT